MREQLLRFGRCIVSVSRHCIQGPFQLANMFRYFVCANIYTNIDLSNDRMEKFRLIGNTINTRVVNGCMYVCFVYNYRNTRWCVRRGRCVPCSILIGQTMWRYPSVYPYRLYLVSCSYTTVHPLFFFSSWLLMV